MRLAQFAAYGLGLLTILVATHAPAFAGTPNVAPEIDGGSLSAGLGLLAASVLIVRARMRSK